MAYPVDFFEIWKPLNRLDAFLRLAEGTNLIQRLDRLTETDFEFFRAHFEEFLGAQTPVYKRVLDYYNAQGTVDEAFYKGAQDATPLNLLALEAEKEFSTRDDVRKEFEKLITKLYFESLVAKGEFAL